MEKRGFYVTLAVCVAVIVASAIWARLPIETEQQSVAVGDGANFLQRISDMVNSPAPPPTAAPSPTPEPKWIRPLPGAVLRPFDDVTPIYQPTMDAWAVHKGVDIAATAGETVLAPRDCKVAGVARDPRYGLTIELLCQDGSLLRIMGLGSTKVAVGSTVRAGDAIAVTGGNIPAESLDPPHIHVEWIVGGTAANVSGKWD